jgi:hypothetical protein
VPTSHVIIYLLFWWGKISMFPKSRHNANKSSQFYVAQKVLILCHRRLQQIRYVYLRHDCRQLIYTSHGTLYRNTSPARSGCEHRLKCAQKLAGILATVPNLITNKVRIGTRSETRGWG